MLETFNFMMHGGVIMKTLNKLLEKLCDKLYFAIVNRNISELKTETNSIIYRILNDYSVNNLKELQKELLKYQKWTDGIAGVFDTEDEKIAYQMGMLGGTVAAITQLKDEQEQIKSYEIAHLDTKYQESIIEQLIGKEYIQHNQLAKNLNISPSQLSTIMNKLDDEHQNIISMSRVGKFKYYCLTDLGRRYYYNKNKGDFREEIDELLQCVLDTRIKKKQDTVKHFIDKYYCDDLELKQKAVKVDTCLYFLEYKNNSTKAPEVGWNDTDIESNSDTGYMVMSDYIRTTSGDICFSTAGNPIFEYKSENFHDDLILQEDVYE